MSHPLERNRRYATSTDVNRKQPRQPLRAGRQVLAGLAFTDVGGRPAIARGAIRQKGYEPRFLLVVRGATGDHHVGQVCSVDGVYQSLRSASPGSPTSATSCGWKIEKSKAVPWHEESLGLSRGARHGECSGDSTRNTG
jgi:hypothetical protein